MCGDSKFVFVFFLSFYFNSTFFLSLDTIQHIESLSLLFNNNYYLSFIIIILKLSKDSLRGRSASCVSIIFSLTSSSFFFISLYYFAYNLRVRRFCLFFFIICFILYLPVFFSLRFFVFFFRFPYYFLFIQLGTL